MARKVRTASQPNEADGSEVITPFLKWPGGKRWFTANHSNLFPKTFKRYIEPFLGGASVFFFLRPKKALIGDTNRDLIRAYQTIKVNWVALEDRLRLHDSNHGVRYYYRTRDSAPRKEINRAAWLVYLNRTCFNGIYRVNLQGRFNVPKGTKNAVLYDNDDFKAIAQALSNADIRVSDFELLTEEARKDDLIFADPPYTVRHNLNGFVKYNETLFSWDDQVRLADALTRARNRGAKIVSTNANHSSVRELYRARGFTLKTVSRFSPISADPESRTQFEELVILAN